MPTKAKDKKEIRKGGGRGSHPNSRANLKPVAPGEVRNPAGRTPGTKDRATLLRKWLEVELELLNPVTREKQQGTVEDEVVLALIAKARKGDVSAIREVLDSMYGKVKDRTEHSFDFSQLSDEEIKQGEQLLSKLIGK
jgi:hypothetical protein